MEKTCPIYLPRQRMSEQPPARLFADSFNWPSPPSVTMGKGGEAEGGVDKKNGGADAAAAAAAARGQGNLLGVTASWVYVGALVVAVGTAHLWMDSANLMHKQTGPTFASPLPPTREGIKDCSWPTAGRMLEEFTEVYSFLHFVNWFVAGACMENAILAWVASLLDEIVEIMNGDLIPTYKECWFDHIGSDLLGCNLLGVLGGAWFSRRFLKRNRPPYTVDRFGYWDCAMLGVLHVSLFNFGFSMKHALKLEASHPLFLGVTASFFMLELLGQGAYITHKLNGGQAPLPGIFKVYSAINLLLWLPLVALDAGAAALMLCRSVFAVLIVAAGYRVTVSMRPEKMD
jgi:hypothetical protein